MLVIHGNLSLQSISQYSIIFAIHECSFKQETGYKKNNHLSESLGKEKFA